MRKFRIPYIPYRSLLLSTTVLNDTVLNDNFGKKIRVGKVTHS